ncbi:hypothetical protein MNBD_GAMMA22-1058 [hydrothermal vent metagenome]|uniref:Uncharacterized protein n=1 Tax=hydrothermal vent metagenome TaxID=652676 RepID=A0A3B1B4I7_9ZZZZ
MNIRDLSTRNLLCLLKSLSFLLFVSFCCAATVVLLVQPIPDLIYKVFQI